MVASTIANVNRDSKQSAYSFKDFMLEYDRQEGDGEMTPEEERVFFENLTAMFTSMAVQRGDDRPDGSNPDGGDGGIQRSPVIG